MIVEGRIDEADSYFREELKNVPQEEYQDYVIDVASIYSDYNFSDKAMEPSSPRIISTRYSSFRP